MDETHEILPSVTHNGHMDGVTGLDETHEILPGTTQDVRMDAVKAMDKTHQILPGIREDVHMDAVKALDKTHQILPGVTQDEHRDDDLSVKCKTSISGADVGVCRTSRHDDQHESKMVCSLPGCSAIFVMITTTRIIALRSVSTKMRIITICETKTILK